MRAIAVSLSCSASLPNTNLFPLVKESSVNSYDFYTDFFIEKAVNKDMYPRRFLGNAYVEICSVRRVLVYCYWSEATKI